MSTLLRPCAMNLEELSIEAVFSPVTGESPDVLHGHRDGPSGRRHTDVSLWFVLTSRTSQSLAPDPHEFRAACWWTRARIRRADPALFLT